MARRNRDQRWGEIRALRLALRESGTVKMRVSLDDIPVVLTIEIRDSDGNLVYLGMTQASTEWQTVTEWLEEAMRQAVADLEDTGA